MHKSVPANCRLALMLSYLASTAEYRTVGNLSVFTLRGYVKLRFPTGQELLQVMQDYKNRRDFPMFAVCIDGTHTSYINRKGFHSFSW